MPFDYQGYRSPFANSIAEIMLRRGDIAARQAETIGNAQARAAEASGNAWAGASQSIGQAIAGIPAQIQQAKRADTIDQMNALRLKQAQGEGRSQTIFETELKNPENRNPDGSINDAKVTAALQGKDVGAWQHWADISQRNQKNALETTKVISELQTADLTNQEKQRQAVAVRNEYLGKLAFSGEQILDAKPDDPLHARDTVLAIVGRAAADGMVTEDQAKGFMARTARAGPDQLRQVFASFVPPELRGKLEKEAADTAKAKSEADKFAAEAANLKQYGSATRPNFEQKNVTLDGKANQLVNFDPKSGQMFLPGSTDAIDATRVKANTPPSIVIHNGNAAAPDLPAWALDDSRPTGPTANHFDAKVHMTPNGLYQAAVTYIATGQFPPTGRGGDPVAVAMRSAITSKVGAIAAASGMDEPALRAFYKANGASLAQQQKSLDAVQGFMATADKNTDLLEKTLAKIPDVGVPAFNGPIRELSKKFAGNADVSQFAIYLQSVQNEYARIISQPNLAGQLTDSARHEAEALVKPDATVKQIIASLQALRNEGSNRLVSIGDQIQRIQSRMTVGGTGGNAGVASKGDPLGLFK